MHRCVAEHSFWVERAYQLQPSSIEAQEAYFEQFREPLLEVSIHGTVWNFVGEAVIRDAGAVAPAERIISV